jgi:hypothetical protein
MSELHTVSEATYSTKSQAWSIECSCGWGSSCKGPDALVRLDVLGQKHESQNGERRRLSDSRYDKFIHRTTRFMAAMFIWMMMVGFLSLYLLQQTSEQASRIQDQRSNLLLSSCKEQNKRHDDTIKELALLVSQAPDLAAAKAAQPGTIALINAIAPISDCNAYVKRNVK